MSWYSWETDEHGAVTLRESETGMTAGFSYGRLCIEGYWTDKMMIVTTEDIQPLIDADAKRYPKE